MTDRLVIDRHHCRYRVPRNHPDPVGVRHQLDRVATDRVPELLANALSVSMPSGDQVVVIRRLDLRVLLPSADLGREATTALWATGLARAVSRSLTRNDDTIAWFASRAEYLASFLDVVAGGRAPIWPFEQFRRLLAAGPSSTVRLILTEHADAPLDVLIALDGRDDGALARALTALAGDDAIAVAAVAGVGSAARRDSANVADASMLTTIVAALRDGRTFAASPAHLALWLLGRAAGASDLVPVPVEIQRALATVAALGPDLLAAGLIDHPGPLGASAVDPPVRELVERQVPGLLDALEQRPPEAATIDPATDGGTTWATPFGGVALAVVALADLDLGRRLVEVGIDPERASDLAGRLRRLAMVATLGPTHRARARVDPVLSRLAGDPGADLLDDDVAAMIDDTRAAALHDALGRRMVAWRPPIDPIVRDAAPLGAGHLVVSRDATGAWIRVDLTDRPPVAPPPSVDPRPAIPDLGRDVAHLDPGPATGPDGLRSIVVHLAAIASGQMARQIPGFSTSSAPYVADNLLVGAGMLRIDDGGCTVTLPDVPLRIALQMAGWDARTLPVPWLPGGRLDIVRSDPW